MTSLKENRIKVLDWPGNSADCNPFANIRAILKLKVHKKNPKTELIAVIDDIWKNDIEVYKNVINTIHLMPRRKNAVIKTRGGNIKY